MLVVQGTDDRIVGPERGPAVASAIPGARLLLMEGSGHGLHLRDPVRFNLELAGFLERPQPAVKTFRRGRSRRRRALYVSSPIGLGPMRGVLRRRIIVHAWPWGMGRPNLPVYPPFYPRFIPVSYTHLRAHET